MTTQLTILVDLDNTIVGWEPALARDCALANPKFPSEAFALRDSYLLWTLPDTKETILAAMRRAGFYREMDILPGAREALELMVAAGHKVFLASQPDVDNPTGHSDKLWWVNEYLGAHWRDRLILTHDKSILRGDVLIDDKPGIECSMPPLWDQIVFTQKYNLRMSGPRIDSWLDLDHLRALGLIAPSAEIINAVDEAMEGVSA